MQEIMNYFEEYLDYLRAEKNVSHYTIDNYTSDFKVFLTFLSLNNIEPRIETLTTRDLRKYLIYLKTERKYQNETIRRKVNAIRSFFYFLKEQDYIEKNVSLSIHAPRKEEKLPIYMSTQELEVFLKVIEQTGKENALMDLCFFKTLAHTGMRRQEAVNLDWNDINFGINTIKIRMGKGKKVRIVPMTDSLSASLWDYLQTRLPLSSQAVFISNIGSRMRVNVAQTRFTKYIKKANFEDRGFTIHKLRHTYASHLVQNGVDVLAVQKLLGHADLNSTKVYAHINTEFLKQEIRKLPFN